MVDDEVLFRCSCGVTGLSETETLSSFKLEFEDSELRDKFWSKGRGGTQEQCSETM